MSIIQHTISFVDGAAPAQSDRLLAALYSNTPTPAGSGAGASVTVAFALNLAVPYQVQVTASQDAVAFVTKTATGFTVTINPRLAANTLVAGTIDVAVYA